MKKEKKGFFAKMLNSEHKVFETSMFGISVILSLALVVGIGYVSFAYFDNNTITDEEANASSVTDGAITVEETHEPVATPVGNMIVNEDEMGATVDEDLASATEGYTTANVNMRDDTALTARVIAKVPMGTKLIFKGIKNTEWMKVEYNGQEGYINAMYLSVDKPKPIEIVTPFPTSSARTKAPVATPTPKGKETSKPTKKPVNTKVPAPTSENTQNAVATSAPTSAPTEKPTSAPTEKPTSAPTEKPTAEPVAEE